MRKIIIVLCSMAIIGVGLAQVTQAETQVASKGVTVIAATVGKMELQVKIKTHERDIGKPSDGRPPEINSCCTYSKYPCSIVDRLEILVNDNELFIPRSVFCDLADLNNVEVKAIKEGASLILYGGDASESYQARIEFNTDQVIRRILSSAMTPDQPLQETVYYIQVLE